MIKNACSNTKHIGRHSLMKDEIAQMRAIEEMICVIDSKEEEMKQA